MPKDKGPKRRGSDLVLCNCHLYCLKPNPHTGRTEGRGQYIPPRTRVRHRRDAQLQRLLRIENAPGRIPSEVASGPDTPIPEVTWMDGLGAELELLADIPPVDRASPLVFASNPAETGPYEREWDDLAHRETIPNTGPHSLLPGAPANSNYLRLESKLWSMYRTLSSFEEDGRRFQLQDKLIHTLRTLEREKELQWNMQRMPAREMNVPIHYNQEPFTRLAKPMSSTVRTAAITCAVLQNIFATSRRALDTHMGGLRDLLRSSGVPPQLYNQLPKDPRTLTSRIRLEPHTTAYLACPKCNALYRLTSEVRDAQQQICTYKKTPGSQVCETRLWKEVDRGPYGVSLVPVKKFVHQDIRHWMGQMLSRPNIEELLEGRPTPQEYREGQEIDDIWLSSVFRGLKGPDGGSFYPGTNGELRLVFSLSVDGFDPFGSKTAKQSVGSTGIWLVLLNLPHHLRYLQENVYTAGIIPGPNKPSSDELNHYIQLVVDDFKCLWRSGVFFSKTYKFQNGRLARAIIVPLVCDLLAARQVIGYPGSTTAHYFCTCCDLDYDDIDVIDPKEWPRKDPSLIRRCALLHRDAQTETDQEAIFEAFGWRWSPLFELEYWDPSMFTVIDSMHSLDLNMLKHHCRLLFQIDVKQRSGDALRKPISRAPKRITNRAKELQELVRCQEVIFANNPDMLFELVKFHRKVLYSFSLDYDIRAPGHELVVGTRYVLGRNIYLWRQRESETRAIFLRTYPELSAAQSDLKNGSAEKDIDDGAASDSDDEDRNPGTLPQDVPGNPNPSGPEQRDPQAEGEVLNLPAQKVLVSKAHKITDPASRSGSFYRSVTAHILAHFVDLLDLNRSTISLRHQSAKGQLWSLLTTEFDSNSNSAERLKLLFPKDDAPMIGRSPFLGKDVMENVWMDMKRTRLPSWITPAPYDWGTPRRGKLSADNWRVICCIHLPITLCRLFGQHTGRKRELLDNFMDLVSAVRIATMQRSSKAQIDKYNFHIFRYSRKVKDLYPDYRILPSHHSALHIGTMLERFGPKHAHDSPHYERLIHFFHLQNTNNKLGELEGTLLRTAARAATLRHLLEDDEEAKRLVAELLSRMESIEKERLRGFRLAQIHSPFGPSATRTHDNPVETLGQLEYALLCERLQSNPLERNTFVPRVGRFLESISHHGTTYSIWDSSGYRDSAILFRGDSGRDAGVIRKIFNHRHTTLDGQSMERYYLLVDAYKKLDLQPEVHQLFPMASGFLCHIQSRTPGVLIELNQVVSPAAVAEFSDLGTLHVLPVNREMLSLEIEHDQVGDPEQ